MRARRGPVLRGGWSEEEGEGEASCARRKTSRKEEELKGGERKEGRKERLARKRENRTSSLSEVVLKCFEAREK